MKQGQEMRLSIRRQVIPKGTGQGAGNCGMSPCLECGGKCPRDCRRISPLAFRVLLVVAGRTTPRNDCILSAADFARIFPGGMTYPEYLDRLAIWGRFPFLLAKTDLPEDDFRAGIEELKGAGLILDETHDFGGYPMRRVRIPRAGFKIFLRFLDCVKGETGGTVDGIYMIR